MTLVQLGSIGVPVGTQVSEGDVVGTIGPSGEPEGTEPYVHLGIRFTADPNGYVDPLALLPPRQAPDPAPPVQQTSQVQPPAPPVGGACRRSVTFGPAAPPSGRGKSTCPGTIRCCAAPRDSACACESDAEAAVPLSAGSARPAHAVPSASRSCAELARPTFGGARGDEHGNRRSVSLTCPRVAPRRHLRGLVLDARPGRSRRMLADPARRGRPRPGCARRRRSAPPAARRPASVRSTAPP